MGTPGASLPMEQLEMLKLRMQHTWNVWQFAGRQRVSMFNYFFSLRESWSTVT
jgi:hypothetical protein